VEQKAKCEDIYEPRPKYHWTGGMFRLNLVNFLTIYMPYSCDANMIST